jgi:LysM repeat protein
MCNLRQLVCVAFVILMGVVSVHAQSGEPQGSVESDGGIMADFEIPEMVQIQVKHGESLYDLAQMSKVNIEALENINGIDLSTPLKGGQRLVIPMTKIALTHFQTARKEFVDSRKASYLAKRGGLIEVRPYRVKTGDSAWNISRANGRLPVWFLKSFNPKSNLNRISIGQTIFVPVVGDTVPLEGPDADEPHGDATRIDIEEEPGC